MSSDLYILDSEGRPVRESDMLKWGKFFEDREARRVGRDEINGVIVSTVFLGMDHNYGDGGPVLWETMVFGGKLDQEMDRCGGTREQAEAMHAAMLKRVKEPTNPCS